MTKSFCSQLRKHSRFLVEAIKELKGFRNHKNIACGATNAATKSGAISLNDIHIKRGGSSGTQVSINDVDIDTISKNPATQMSFNEWYGASH